MNPTIVAVENIEERLRNTYGASMHVAWDKAVLGERRGKWKILWDDPLRDTRSQDIQVNQVFRSVQYEKIVKKRIAWIQDRDIEWRGGAEISGKRAMEVGALCGFDISLVTPMNFPKNLAGSCDLMVLNNLFNFGNGHITEIQYAAYEKRVPYIKYEHDHRELCRPEFSRKLFERSALNVFLSPSHLKNHEEGLGVKGVAMPLAIDPRQFSPVKGVRRIPNTALVCNVRSIKTWNLLQEYIRSHPKIQFTILSPTSGVQEKNVSHRPLVPYEDMPRLYSSYEYLVHIMDSWGAGERVILEAALCGCNVVTNEKVGHASWGWELTDIPALTANLLRAPYDFWKAVDAVLRTTE